MHQVLLLRNNALQLLFLLEGLSERDFDGYINFRIILFHIPFAIFRFKFPHDIVNPITVCYWFTSNRYFFSATICRNLQSWLDSQVLIPVGVRALNWKQIKGVAFMHKPDWSRDISA